MESKIIHADCLEAMKEMEDNSIDCVVTDPPFGYGFMNKKWDTAVPKVEIWKECLRILKPGAFMFAMSAPRQDVMAQMIVNLKEAGFRLDFTSLYWAYASGFPKASNIGKMIDKRLGAERKVVGYSKLNPKDKKAYIPNDNSTFNASQSKGVPITKPVTSQAKQLDGSYGGFQPKPAVEVILVAMKPLTEKTFVDQALKNGKGVTWLDDCRVPYESEDLENRKSRSGKSTAKGEVFKSEFGKIDFENSVNPQGRFPANLTVSDDVLNDGINKSSHGGGKQNTGSKNNWLGESDNRSIPKGDSGSFSRYFSLDQWWTEKLKNLPEKVRKTFPFLICPKASKSEKNKGLGGFDEKKTNDGRKKEADNAFQRGSTLRTNNHPTTKPIDLMSYLIILGSREGDIVLDPFVGSGTTCLAAHMLNRKWVGIEKEKEYYEIGKARLKHVEQQLTLF